MAGQLVVPIRDRWSAKAPPGSQKPTLEFHEIPAPSNSSLVQEVSKFLKRLRGDSSIAGCYAKYDLEAMVCGTKCEKS